VAQRTGAERFLAAWAKSASAGLCLALALAALLLAGCGAGSSEPQAASTAAGQASDPAPGGAAADSPNSQGSSRSPGGSAETPAAQAAEEGAAGGAGIPGSAPAGGAGAKHGPRIAAPKGRREKAPTPQEKAEATVADMTLQSPAIHSQEGPLTFTYACDGRDLSPPLNWSGVPAGTKELILYVMNGQPVGGRLFFDWAVAGIDPASSGIEIGKLPPGAVVGTNSFGARGYSICPPAGSAETYVFALFALPTSLDPQKGFDPRPLREEILAASRDVGLLITAYARE
jgi:phosphatidylethanolamine-binding protein (PEBP) family uncharacterized protein